jgi:hypothetical protein
MEIDDLTAQTFGLSDHQRNFFSTLLSFYDIKGKDVLEVGGAMPSGLVLDYLGVNSWTCVQSQEYAAHRSDNQTPSANLGNGRYSAIYANIEDLVVRFINMVTYHATSRSNFFQRNTTGAAFISSMPFKMRALSSGIEATRIWRRKVRAIFENAHSIRLSQDPCLGV